MVAKLQGDESAFQSSMELYYPWISGPHFLIYVTDVCVYNWNPVLPFLDLKKKNKKKKTRKTHQKDKDFESLPNAQNPWKRREEHSKKPRNSSQGKRTRNSPKTRKGRTGNWKLNSQRILVRNLEAPESHKIIPGRKPRVTDVLCNCKINWSKHGFWGSLLLESF